jgi:hypothetical protein
VILLFQIGKKKLLFPATPRSRTGNSRCNKRNTGHCFRA